MQQFNGALKQNLILKLGKSQNEQLVLERTKSDADLFVNWLYFNFLENVAVGVTGHPLSTYPTSKAGSKLVRVAIRGKE